MKSELNMRQREIVGTATTLYETLAESTLKNLEALNLPTVAVQTALGNVEVIRQRLGTTALEVEIQEDLRVTVHDALMLMSQKVDKAKKDQLKLTIPTSETEETEELVLKIARHFGSQPVLL